MKKEIRKTRKKEIKMSLEMKLIMVAVLMTKATMVIILTTLTDKNSQVYLFNFGRHFKVLCSLFNNKGI